MSVGNESLSVLKHGGVDDMHRAVGAIREGRRELLDRILPRGFVLKSKEFMFYFNRVMCGLVIYVGKSE